MEIVLRVLMGRFGAMPLIFNAFVLFAGLKRKLLFST
jgi:hypothetical protein